MNYCYLCENPIVKSTNDFTSYFYQWHGQIICFLCFKAVTNFNLSKFYKSDCNIISEIKFLKDRLVGLAHRYKVGWDRIKYYNDMKKEPGSVFYVNDRES